MISFRVFADIKEDRQVVLDVPARVPVGEVELVVTVEPRSGPAVKRPATSLADWAEQNAEDWGDRLDSEDVETFTGRRS
jgi:hypothetical protein